jgi:zinc D-Ala-D-Ala carboxypeptidase
MADPVLSFNHWREAMGAWPYKNFSPAELASKGDGSLRLNKGAMAKLVNLRVALGRPMLITSAYRDPAHNRRVGGATHSMHLEGKAFDVRMENHDPAEFEAVARTVGFTGFGYYPQHGFMHIDTGPERSWGTKFPLRETRFAPESVPTPKAQAAKEGTSVAAIAVAAERIVNEAAPILPDAYVSIGFTAVAVIGLGVVLWRMFRVDAE